MVESKKNTVRDRRAKAQRDAREIELINGYADRLNADAEYTLDYQAPWPGDEPGARSLAVKKKRRR
jgi:hypothetical protein